MATAKGRDAVKRFLASIPTELETKVLRGAAKAAATVVADEAKARVISSDVRGSIKVATRREEGRMVAKVQTKGEGAYIAPWLEYGTDPHFISVDDSQREGRSVRRINEMAKGGSLVIGGQFVGTTVHHPGARPYPFLRPALDAKEGEAVAAAQAHINARVSRAGIAGTAEGDEE